MRHSGGEDDDNPEITAALWEEEHTHHHRHPGTDEVSSAQHVTLTSRFWGWGGDERETPCFKVAMLRASRKEQLCGLPSTWRSCVEELARRAG